MLQPHQHLVRPVVSKATWLTVPGSAAESTDDWATSVLMLVHQNGVFASLGCWRPQRSSLRLSQQERQLKGESPDKG